MVVMAAKPSINPTRRRSPRFLQRATKPICCLAERPKKRSGSLGRREGETAWNRNKTNCRRAIRWTTTSSSSAPPRGAVSPGGVPAKIVGAFGCGEPARDMDQLLSDIADDSFNSVI